MSLAREIMDVLRRAGGPLSSTEIRAEIDHDDPKKASRLICTALVQACARGEVQKIDAGGGQWRYVAVPGYVPKRLGPVPGSKRAKAGGDDSQDAPRIELERLAAKNHAHLLSAQAEERSESARVAAPLDSDELALRLACAVRLHWQGPAATLPTELRQLCAEAFRRAA